MSKSAVYYCRSPFGEWLLQDTSGLFVADLPHSFWSNNPQDALRFDTEADAQACAGYLNTATHNGLLCNALQVLRSSNSCKTPSH